MIKLIIIQIIFISNIFAVCCPGPGDCSGVNPALRGVVTAATSAFSSFEQTAKTRLEKINELKKKILKVKDEILAADKNTTRMNENIIELLEKIIIQNNNNNRAKVGK